MLSVKDIIPFLSEHQENIKVHCARGSKDSFLPLRLFQQGGEKFKVFQEEQTQKNFERKYILSLIYKSKDEWLFAGIYESISVKETPKGNSKYRYKTRLVKKGYDTDLIGKLVICFRKSFRASYLRLENYIDDLEVLEITREISKRSFPGYDNVNISWMDLASVINTDAWKTALENQKGVYLITDISNEKRYVGSAYGKDMLWGRWSDYIHNGHGGNEQLKALEFDYIKSNFRYSILEIFKSTTDDDTILKREAWWKEVLLTIGEYGYNMT